MSSKLLSILLGTWVLSYFMPKPQTTPPAGLNSIQAPTAAEGGSIAVLFGTKVVKGPNVVWYGDLKTQPIQGKGGKK